MDITMYHEVMSVRYWFYFFHFAYHCLFIQLSTFLKVVLSLVFEMWQDFFILLLIYLISSIFLGLLQLAYSYSDDC